jgi:DNA-nicking Smr family endonuclease
MSKKRKNEPAPRNFRNDPFRSLKDISTNPRSPVADASVKPPPDADADDDSLFARAVRGARPIGRGEEPAGGTESSSDVAAPPSASHEEIDDGLFLQAMTSLGASTVRSRAEEDVEPDEESFRRSSSSRMRQLKKGTVRIAQELDLHGSLREEALRRLQHFVTGAYARGDQAVLVITGKGINSPEGPVLSVAVSEWLRGPGKEMVAEFHQAPRDKGGSGAVVVFLRSRK